MPYSSNKNLPKQVANVLPEAAQEIYRKAYNNALKQYKDPEKRRGNEDKETTASKVAWAAVKNEYEKDENTGKWHKK